jgi:hypothetical protein
MAHRVGGAGQSASKDEAAPARHPHWPHDLAEIGINGGSAAARFGLVPGTPVRMQAPA